MAGEFDGMAQSLQIPSSVMNNLDAVDKKIKDIATDSERMSKQFQSSMSVMSKSAGELHDRLQAIQNIINNIGRANFGSIGNVSKGFNETSKSAEKAASSVAKAATSLNKFSNPSISSSLSAMTEKLRKLGEDIKMYYSAIGTGKKSYVDFGEKGLKQAVPQAEALMRAITALSAALDRLKNSGNTFKNYIDGLNGATLASRKQNDEMKRLNDYYRELEKTSARQANAAERAAQQQQKAQERAAAAAEKAAEREAKAAERAAQRQMAAQAKLDSRLRKSNYQSYVTSTEGSLRTAGKANTYAQRAQAIKNLEAAMKRLNVEDKNYEANLKRLSAEYKRLSAAQKEFQKNMGAVAKSSHNLMDISGQLARRIALIFSVSSISGFVNKMIQVRGEFELQQTALASILDSKDKANELFAQVVDLAVQSPYTIKELNSYTKQLAAYQIQYEDLYDTLKRLADVASGLGVDMQRLILAFGQVKAANYLRGTEVRQFTEAGLNILGELASYYSELEGRMVSVGEVQEMVSKRMVAFGDVEEVFKRVTSAGGMFYDMQLRQAQTLRGQMMNLQDQYDLMLNELGQSSQGAIYDIISMVKSILDNWEKIADVMTPIIAFLSTYWLLTNKWFGLIPLGVKLWKSFEIVLAAIPPIQRAMNLQQKTFNKLTKANAWLLVLGLIATAVFEVVNAMKSANKEAEEFNRIADEAYNDAKLSIAQYKRLANTVTDTTKTYQEQEAALKELQRVYRDILPDQYLQVDSIRALKGEYKGAEQAILNYMKVRAQERQINYIEENYGKDVQNSREDFAQRLQARAQSLYDITIPTIDVGHMLDRLEDDLRKGLIKDSGAFNRRIAELMSEYLQFEVPAVPEGESAILSSMGDYYNSLIKMNDAIKNVLSGDTIGFATNIERELQTMRDDAQETIDTMNSLFNTISHMGELGEDGKLITYEQVDTAKKNLTDLVGGLKLTEEEINSLKETINNLTGDAWEIQNVIPKFTQAILKGLQVDYKGKIASAYNDETISIKKAVGIITSSTSAIERIDDEIQKLDDTPFQDYVEGIIEEAAKLEDIDLGRFVRYLPKDMETVDEFTKRVKNRIEQIESDIAKYDKHPSLIAQWFGKPEERDKAEKELNVLRKLLAGLVDDTTKNRGSGKDPRLKQLEDNIKLLEEAMKRYKELREEFSDEYSSNAVRDMFKGTPVENVVATMTFDASGMVDGIKTLYEQASKGVSSTLKKEMDKARDEAARPFETELLITPRIKKREELEKEIDDMFSQYELSQDLSKSSISPDLIKGLFDVDILDLDTLENKIKGLAPLFVEAGLNWEEAWEKIEERLTQASEKQLQERIKKYAEYLKKATDQTLLVQMNTGKDINYATDLFDEGKLDAEQYATLLKALIQDMNSQISKINVDKFKDSAEYIRAMGDMSMYSKKELDKLLETVRKLITDSAGKLNASDLKVYLDTLEKIEKAQFENRSPWEKTNIAEIRELKRLQEELQVEKERYNTLLEQKENLQAKLQEAIEELNRLKEMQNANPNANYSGQIANTQSTINSLTQQSGIIDNMLSNSAGKMSGISSMIDNMSGGLGQTLGIVDKIITSVYQSINATAELFNEAKSVAAAFGAETDKGAWENASIVMGTIGQVNQNVMDSWNSFKSGDMLGATVSAIKAVTSIIKGIAQLHDNKLQQQIDKEQEKVEKLQIAYHYLEKAVEDAFSSSNIKSANKAALNNLDQQEQSIRKMMALEKEKKDSDEDAIKDYEQQLRDLEETREQLLEDMQSSLTGGVFDDIISAAESFTQAWLDAFRETGDGISGIEDSFNDLMETLLVRQATLQFISPYIDKLKDRLDRYINEDDTELTVDEAEAFGEYAKSMFDDMNEQLKNYFTGLANAGIDIGAGDTLSGLQKGIQSITEETAQALEALLNSIRFYVSDIRSVMNNIYSSMFLAPETSPYYQQMLLQTQYLRSINDLVIATSTYSSNNGRVFKVKIV